MTTSVPTADLDVIIPVYNAERFLEAALRSVLGQTLPPRRIIAVDDGSTDGSAAIVHRIISEEHPGIRVEYLHRANGGPNAARNAGLQVSDARYVAFLDSDDLWMPDKIARQMALFNASSGSLGLVYCEYREINADGTAVRSTAVEGVPHLRGWVFDRLIEANRIKGSASAVVIKKTCFDNVGPFDESLRGSEDWDMWLRISKHFEVDLVEAPLVAIRRHSSSAQADVALMLRNMIAFYMKWFTEVRTNKAVCRYWGHLIAEFALRSPDPSAARRMSDRLLTPAMKKAFFGRTFGSLALYMRLKRIRQMASKPMPAR